MKFKQHLINEAKKPKSKAGKIASMLKKKFGDIKKGLKRVVKKRPKKKPKITLDTKFIKKYFSKFKKKIKFLRESQMDDAKISALIEFMDDEHGEEVTVDDIDNPYDNMYEVSNMEFLVLSDAGADEAVKEYIEESVWAFNYDFLAWHIDDEDLERYYGIETSYYDEDLEEYVELDFDEAFYMHMGMNQEEWIKHLQGKFESGNSELINIIGDFDHFVEQAINADGRGHFLSGYDGDEHEYGDMYIYRTN